MDFDEAAESAVAKRKFLLNRLMKKKFLPDDDDQEKVAKGNLSVINGISRATLIRVCDCRDFIIISETPRKTAGE